MKISAQKSSIIFLVGVVVFLAINFIASSIISSVHGGRHTQSEIIASIFIQVSLLAVFFIFTKVGKSKLPYSFKFDVNPTRNKNNLIIILLTPVIALFSLLAFYGPTLGFELLLQSMGYSPPPTLEMNTAAEMVLGVLLIVVFAAVCEEFFIRGGLMSGLHNKYGAKYAVIVTAFAFSLMHMNPSQTVFQFGLGIVIGILVIRTMSILPAILLHAFSNSYALIIYNTSIAQGLENFILGDRTWLVVLTFITLSLVFGAGLFFLFKYLFKSKPETIKIETDDKTDISKKVFSEPPNVTPAKDGTTFITKEKFHQKPSVASSESGADRLIFYAGIAICGFMWLISLLMGFGMFG